MTDPRWWTYPGFELETDEELADLMSELTSYAASRLVNICATVIAAEGLAVELPFQLDDDTKRWSRLGLYDVERTWTEEQIDSISMTPDGPGCPRQRVLMAELRVGRALTPERLELMEQLAALSRLGA